ncbi:MAG: leucine-rich repeat protein [Clostridia bacterium]|nr:leucine-rich repeat protein [Clostridia bacterium]
MTKSCKKIIAFVLALITLVCFTFGTSAFFVNAENREYTAVSAIETYKVKVGETKYLFLDEADKAVQSAVWKSNAPYDVEILSQDSVFCEIKVNNYLTSKAIITCEYYYQQLNSLTGQIWLIKGAKSFYIETLENTVTTTPAQDETTAIADQPKGPFKYDNFTAGVYTYMIKADGTAEVIAYEPKLETGITIPKYMDDYLTTSIGNNAFEYLKALIRVTVPEGVTSIGEGAFYGCSALETLNLPENLKMIGDEAFYNCNNLKTITLPENLEKIGEWAFCGCDSLESIFVPAGVEDIGLYAFGSCDSLAAMEVSEDNNNFSSMDGVLYTKDMKTILQYPKAKPATEDEIPYGVETVGNRAFNSCNNLESIVIPQSVKTIEKNAFAFCDKLKTISIPEGVEALGDEAFYKCTSLESIYIPDSVTDAGYRTFYGCDNLKTIYGIEDSYAQWYANENGYDFVAVEKPVIPTISATEPTQEVVTTVDLITVPTEENTTEIAMITEPTEKTTVSSVIVTEPEESSKTSVILTTSAAISTPKDEFEMGDVNMDGKLNIKDATLIQKYAAKIVDFDEAQKTLADINKDEKINVKDATYIQKVIAKIL